MHISLSAFQNVLLSDSSSADEDEHTVSAEDVNNLLEMHNYQKGCRTDFYNDTEVSTINTSNISNFIFAELVYMVGLCCSLKKF